MQRLLAIVWFLAPLLTSAAALETYGELVGKTILAPSALPLLPDSVSELPPDKANAIAFLESQFTKNGISVVQDGPSFVRLLRTGQWQAGLSNAPLRGAQLRASPNKDLIPAGAVNFPGTDLFQVLNIYAELKNRTILRSRVLMPQVVRFKNQCALTREEMIYALETVLALDGISTVDDGQAFVQIVPTPLLWRVNAHAPLPEPGDRVFEPKKVPSLGLSDPPKPQTKLQHDLERWRKAFYEFMGLNSTQNSSAQRLLELYANLTDKKAEPSKSYEAMPIWFHVTTPPEQERTALRYRDNFCAEQPGNHSSPTGHSLLGTEYEAGEGRCQTGCKSGTQITPTIPFRGTPALASDPKNGATIS